jgi:hypothetical protein
MKDAARSLLDRIERIRRGTPRDRKWAFFRLMNAERKAIADEEQEAQVWRMALLLWTTRYPQASFENERRSLGSRFVHWLVGYANTQVLAEYELHLKPAATRSGLVRLQVELQEDLNFNDQFYEFAPVAVNLALTLVPFGLGARGLALAVQFVAGVFDFLVELHRLKSNDGKLDEKEMEEVWWGVLGILPFKIVELIVLGRLVVVLVPHLAILLYEAIGDFINRLEFMQEARNAGWEGGLLADSPYGIFIPDFAIEPIS